jgi:hypothetical protein
MDAAPVHEIMDVTMAKAKSEGGWKKAILVGYKLLEMQSAREQGAREVVGGGLRHVHPMAEGDDEEQGGAAVGRVAPIQVDTARAGAGTQADAVETDSATAGKTSSDGYFASLRRSSTCFMQCKKKITTICSSATSNN